MAVSESSTVELEFEPYRGELTGYCYRMLGSGFEAEDAVQDTFLRAWKNLESFEGRSALRSWLYKIATNVCLDMMRSSQRRARAMDLGPSATTDGVLPDKVSNDVFVQPVDDRRVLGPHGDPAELTEYRESVRLAFVAALQHLPARQRAVLILREVLKWQATEVAELLETSVASVNSALQRARASLAEVNPDETPPLEDPDRRKLLARYVDAFERYDIDSLVTLLHDEVRFSMPPYPMWLLGPEEVHRWMLGPGFGCRGSRLLQTTANGCPAVAQYRPAGPGRWEPWALQILEIRNGKIVGLHNYLNSQDLFVFFGLPPYLEETADSS